MFDHGYALLIGVDQNKIADLALPIVKKDVAKLKEVITHPDRCGYPEKHVRVLTDAEATRANIISGLDWLKESLLADKEPSQTTFIYYSGHGHRDESGESFLIPYDFRFPVGLGALAARDFAAIVEEISPRRLTVILDCCHAEAMGVKDVAGHSMKTAALTPETPGIAALAKGDGRAILSSSRGDQKSWIRKDEQMSVFTYHLIETLTGHVGRPDEPEVLVTEVMDYVARKVPATTRAEWKAEQEPAFQMSGSAFPLALVLGGKGIQKGVAAPDPLVKLPVVIKSQMDVDTIEGEATNVEVGRLRNGQIDANAKVGTVKKGGKLVGVKIDEAGS
jgi:uncharacterized caspase-like protein